MTDDFRSEAREIAESAAALVESMRISAQGEDVWRFASYQGFARKYNQLAERAMHGIPGARGVLDVYDLDNIPPSTSTIAVQQKNIFDSVLMNLFILRSLTERHSGEKESSVNALVDFVAANLRRGLHEVPSNERQVQDALETLLVGRGMEKGLDYDRETGRVKVSIKESVPDFVFLRLDLALEVKLARDVQKSKVIVDEINADIGSYGTKYKHLFFVVYDLGSIRDEAEFRQGLEERPNTHVRVVKH
jgi:hypothetical protein